MDLEKSEAQGLVQKFSFLMSKFAINHITKYNQSDFEEIAKIYLVENLENSDYDKKRIYQVFCQMCTYKQRI